MTVAERLRRDDNRRMDSMRSLFRAFCADEDDVEGSRRRRRADVLELVIARALKHLSSAVPCDGSVAVRCLRVVAPPTRHHGVLPAWLAAVGNVSPTVRQRAR
jgi:hypothetical protein